MTDNVMTYNLKIRHTLWMWSHSMLARRLSVKRAIIKSSKVIVVNGWRRYIHIYNDTPSPSWFERSKRRRLWVGLEV